MLEKIRDDELSIITTRDLVSRKITYRLRNWANVKTNLFTRKNSKSVNFVKKLPQKWRWRWNRKSSNVWKQIRFLRRYNVSGLQVLRVNRFFGIKRVLERMQMWNYHLSRKHLEFNSGAIAGNRLDWVLVATMNARNITEARLKIRRGIVIVNGSVELDYNTIIGTNDIVQVRDNKVQNSLTPLSLKSISMINDRRLYI